MPVVSVERLRALQSQQARIRNVCVLAHVDHGKTTLSDNLIACNGLIHPKMVGKLRYLDSRDDEQLRCITMKSSSISLLFSPKSAEQVTTPGQETAGKEDVNSNNDNDYLINLIDSPGHVDFCSEVSTAVRVTDGAIALVDAVEGVCIQTHAVLRQAYDERLTLCLVINKIDRLICELQLTPEEAYHRLKAIVAEVNNVVSGFQSEKYLSEVDSLLAHGGEGGETGGAKGDEGDAAAEENLNAAFEDLDVCPDVFSPAQGNVVFASAVDGWAFRIEQFADMYAQKLGASAKALRRALWGDYYFNPKTKKIMGKKAAAGKLKPMFAQMVLEPLWKMYNAVVLNPDPEAASKMLNSLKVTVPARDLNHSDTRVAIQSIMSRWLPLADAVLATVVEALPSPVIGQATRLPVLFRSMELQLPEQGAALLRDVERDVASCSATAAAACVCFVSKMFSVPRASLPHETAALLAAHEGSTGPAGSDASSSEEAFVAFARVFSGVLRPGARLYVLSAKYDPSAASSSSHGPQVAEVLDLLLMMGRGLDRLPCAPAGNVVGIVGLGGHIIKSGTLSTSPWCRPFSPMVFQSAPIVTVAIEPAHPLDMDKLDKGLRLLNRADPFVEVVVQETGEHILRAAGEVHLERCLKDLREVYARIEMHVSPPLVAFKEAATSGRDASRVVEVTTPDKMCTIRVRAMAMPEALIHALESSSLLLAAVTKGGYQHHTQPQAQPAHAQGEARVDASAAATATAHVAESSGATPGKGGIGPAAGNGAEIAPSVRPDSGHASAAGAATSTSSTQQVYATHIDTDQVEVLRGRLLAAAAAADTSEQDTLAAAAANNKDASGNIASPNRPGSDAAKGVEDGWAGYLRRVWALGPKKVGPNLLLSGADLVLPPQPQPQGKEGQLLQGKEGPGLQGKEEPGSGGLAAESQAGASRGHAQAGLRVRGVPLLSRALGLADGGCGDARTNTGGVAGSEGDAREGGEEVGGASNTAFSAGGRDHLVESIQSSLQTGFQLAAAGGPLCDEPLWGCAFEVTADVCWAQGGAPAEGVEGEAQASASYSRGPNSGQVITAMRDACRMAVMKAEPRLVEAMTLCQVMTTAEALGKVYAVLSKRRARILQEEMREGSGLFTVLCYLPAAESFGFADELRRKTSGAASPQLKMNHWEIMPEDPFWVPTTEDEIEEFGDGTGASVNLARRFLNATRRRKGLPVEEKVVEHAEKQRTLAKKV
eukprot:jgi/Mesvir1/23838/Mv10643-RA.1